MAVYSVDNSNKRFTLKLTLTEGNYSIAENSSPVSYTLELIANTSYNFGKYSIGSSITLGGINVHHQARTPTKQYSIADYGTLVLASGSKTFTHNADGSLELSVAYSIDMAADDHTAGALSGSGKMTLVKIPRYATANQSLNNKTETTITMNWSSDNTIDYIWYSKDNGANWSGVDVTDGTSGSYTISGLSSGTNYNVKTRVRRKDSQLTTDSSALAVATYDYPYIISVSNSNLVIGDKVNINVYNPLGRYCTAYIKQDSKNGKLLGSIEGFTSGSMEYVLPTDANAMYSSIPSSQEGSCVYYLVCSNPSNESGTVSGKYRIKGTEIPTINTFDYFDGNDSVVDITDNPKHIVQNKSHLTAQFNDATANYGASRIVKYTLEVNGLTKDVTSSGNHNLGMIDSANDVTLTLTATDSRGLSSSKSITVTMLEHSEPKASVFLQRINNYEDETHLKVDGSISSVNGKNTMTIEYRYKLLGGSYGEFEPINDNTEYIFNDIENPLDKNNVYVFNIVVTDAFGSKYDKEHTLDKGIFPLFIDTEKNSVGVNCFPKGDKTFEVSGHEFISSSMCWMGNANTDANKMISQGVWLVLDTPSTNYPLSNGNGLLVVIGQSFGITFQIFSAYSGDTWCRILWYNSWSVWKQMTN